MERISEVAKSWLTIILSLIALFSSASTLYISIAINSERIENLSVKIDTLQRDARDLNTIQMQVARIETEVMFIKLAIQEIKLDIKDLK